MQVVIVHQSLLFLVLQYSHQASFIPFDLRPVKDSDAESPLLRRNFLPLRRPRARFYGCNITGCTSLSVVNESGELVLAGVY
jgi:hypothetical protein